MRPSCPRCSGMVYEDEGDGVCVCCGWREHRGQDGTRYQAPPRGPGGWQMVLANTKVGPVLYDGCDVAPHCLECPLAECKYDNLAPYAAWQKAHGLGRLTVEEITAEVGRGGGSRWAAAQRLTRRKQRGAPS